jgi:ribosome biogenesis GTPase A
MLAASHSIGRNAIIYEEVAAFLGDILLARYPKLLIERYGIPIEDHFGALKTGMDGFALIEEIAKLRCYRIRNNDYDLEKAAMALLQDYRTGALGRISLESPKSRAVMLQYDTVSIYNPSSSSH